MEDRLATHESRWVMPVFEACAQRTVATSHKSRLLNTDLRKILKELAPSAAANLNGNCDKVNGAKD